MADNVKTCARTAARRMLRPVVALMLACGMTWRELAELCKTTFVEVASEQYGLRGRPTNVSRVAILTGLSRREVTRQRARLKSDEAALPERTGHAARVLSAWHRDPDFTDAGGAPVELPLDGGSPNVAELLRRYGGDLPGRALLKELELAGAVETTAGGKLRVLTRHYMPRAMEPESVLRAGSVLHDLGQTLQHNLSRAGRVTARFEGRAANDRIERRWARAFRARVDAQGQQFLESIDDWLSAHQSTDVEPHSNGVKRLGVGVYLIEE